MPDVGLTVWVAGFGSEGPEFKSHSTVESIPGGVNSACHPSEVGKMSASLLVNCVRVVTRPGLCPIAKETAEAAPTLCTEYGPNLLLLLLKYCVNTVYKLGLQMHVIDALSRAYIQDYLVDKDLVADKEVMVHSFIKTLPMTLVKLLEMQQATTEDDCLMELHKLWPTVVETTKMNLLCLLCSRESMPKSGCRSV